ncbi:hypothetical protein JCM19238_106 [Vibrio ponticus]|nr:hypothetical protein JCM19238_106 [Vibrio ponticus]
MLKEHKNRPLMPIPYDVLAKNYYRKKDYDNAIEYSLRGLKEGKQLPTFIAVAGKSMLRAQKLDRFEEFLDLFSDGSLEEKCVTEVNNLASEYCLKNKLDKAKKLLDTIFSTNVDSDSRIFPNINMALLLIKSKQEIPDSLKQALLEDLNTSYLNGNATPGLGISIILNHLDLLDDKDKYFLFFLKEMTLNELDRFINMESLVKELITDELQTNINKTHETLEKHHTDEE